MFSDTQKAEKVGNSLFVKFTRRDKDEFFHLVSVMKSIPGSYYKPKSRCWVLPCTKEVIDVLRVYDFDIPVGYESDEVLPKKFKKVNRWDWEKLLQHWAI